MLELSVMECFNIYMEKKILYSHVYFVYFSQAK